jgi:hypothetical protein
MEINRFLNTASCAAIQEFSNLIKPEDSLLYSQGFPLWSLSGARLNQSIQTLPNFLRFILTLSSTHTHVFQVFPSGLLIEILYAFFLNSIFATFRAQLMPLSLIVLVVLGEEYKL